MHWPKLFSKRNLSNRFRGKRATAEARSAGNNPPGDRESSLAITKVPSSGKENTPSEPSDHGSTPQPQTSSNPPYPKPRSGSEMTFRLRGLPIGWDNAKVEEKFRSGLDLDEACKFSIPSLSCNPARKNENVATLDFRGQLPSLPNIDSLQEWSLSIDDQMMVLDTHFFGLTPLHEKADAECKIDVIAISGLNGHAFGSFKSRSSASTYMWLRDSLPVDLGSARVFIYGYDAGLLESESFQNVGDLGRKVKEAIMAVRDSPMNKKPLVLIGHSLGGILIKAALNEMSEGPENERATFASVDGVAFFGVPHQGIDIKSLVPMVGDHPNRQLLEALGPDSDVLQMHLQRFENAFTPQKAKIISFYETEKSHTAIMKNGKWSMSGPKEVLVDRHSATNGLPRESDRHIVHPINASHSEIVKFKHRFDETYQVVLAFLKSFHGSAKVFSRMITDDEQACLRSLSFREQYFREDQIHEASTTCEWFLQHPAYKAWLEQPSGLLWLEGNPGSGKSTVMKHALQTLKRKMDEDGSLVISFFVYGQGVELQKSLLGILRYLLYQILCRIPELFSELLPEFSTRHRTMGSWEWGPGELRIALRDCLMRACYDRPIILLLDALDELGRSLAPEVLDYFCSLVGKLDGKKQSLRICVSSRHYPIITSYRSLTVCAEKENGRDIITAVRSKLEILEGSSPLITLILSRANGIFQWAMIAADRARDLHITGLTTESIREDITKLPQDLHKLYSSLVRDPQPSTVRLFQWICFAIRPLTKNKIRMAISSLGIGKSHSVSFRKSAGALDSMVKDVSRGLAETYYERRLGKERVRFIHQSVYDYFNDYGFKDLDSSLSVNLEATSHAHLLGTCVRFLGHDLIQEQISKRSPLHETPMLDVTLMGYAADNWTLHAVQLDEIAEMPAFLPPILADPVMISGEQFKIYEKVPGRSFGEPMKVRRALVGYWVRIPHFLVLMRLYNLLESLVNLGDSLAIPDEIGRTPLSVAVLMRDYRAAEILLRSRAVEVNSKDKYGMTPLHHLTRKSFTFDHGGQRHSPMSIAGGVPGILRPLPSFQEITADSRKEAAKVAGLLLNNKMGNPNLLDEHGNSALANAVCNGYAEVVNMMLKVDQIDVNAKDANGFPLLLRALVHGHLNIALLLLKAEGINANVKDTAGCSALSYAARCTFDHAADDSADSSPVQVARLLLSHEVEPDSRDHWGRGPLFYAAKSGSRAIVRLLLETGRIDIDSKDYRGQTPLLVAVKTGSIGVVRQLLRGGSKAANLKDFAGRTPIFFAKDVDIARELLEIAKVDPDVRDQKGRTPLFYFAQSGNFALVDLLVKSFNCDPKSKDNNGKTPISYAKTDRVRSLLLENS